MPRNLTPQQVVTVVRAARLGDLYQVSALIEVMLDSWPVLAKCQHELRSAVSQTKFSVHAYTDGGKKPTKRAQEKADLVQRAMSSFKPNPAMTDEKGWAGMVYDLTHSYLIGISVSELQWYKYQGDKLPRAATFVCPEHITFGNSGEILIAANGRTLPFDPQSFISSQYQNRSGSVLGNGNIRVIADLWARRQQALTWIASTAQRFGSPYTFLTYAQSLMNNQAALDEIEDSLEQSGNRRYIMAPEGCNASLHPPGSLGEDNPQRWIADYSDEQCQLVFLGQTSSTQGEEGLHGNNQSHMDVRAERKEAVSKWIGELLTLQFASAVLRANYGEDSECPTIEPDFTEVETRMEAAQRVAVEINTGLPFVAEELYNDLNRKVPKQGDQTAQQGTLGIMSDTEQPIQPTLEEQAQVLEMQTACEQPAIAASESSHAFYGNQWTVGHVNNGSVTSKKFPDENAMQDHAHKQLGFLGGNGFRYSHGKQAVLWNREPTAEEKEHVSEHLEKKGHTVAKHEMFWAAKAKQAKTDSAIVTAVEERKKKVPKTWITLRS